MYFSFQNTFEKTKIKVASVSKYKDPFIFQDCNPSEKFYINLNHEYMLLALPHKTRIRLTPPPGIEFIFDSSYPYHDRHSNWDIYVIKLQYNFRIVFEDIDLLSISESNSFSETSTMDNDNEGDDGGVGDPPDDWPSDQPE